MVDFTWKILMADCYFKLLNGFMYGFLQVDILLYLMYFILGVAVWAWLREGSVATGGGKNTLVKNV